MSEDLDRYDAVFGALSDGTRRRILGALAERGEATATNLADHVPVSRQAVVKHLSVLDDAALVRSRRRGREVRYRVRPERIAASARWMARLASEWEERLDAIKRVAEAPGDAGASGTALPRD